MMPLLDKLFPSRRSFKSGAETVVSDTNAGQIGDDRNSFLSVGTEHVRILLLRECEWRGRKLLFDSATLDRQQCRNEISVPKINEERKSDGSVNVTSARDLERERTTEDDVSLLSEMVFGTVAMTYRGSSFKIHSLSSPPCLMCTKIFPATEHNVCRQSERVSDEGLGRSVNLDSNSSVRTCFSRPSSGNLSSGNDLNSGPRKSSTCSSTGSGCDIDISPLMGSSQSLESNGSSGIGSLTSLRRRWLRAVSTSLGRSDSDDTFGMHHWTENGNASRDGHIKRHKTRLGLTMLVRLAKGHENKLESRLLEHMALLEGMLDRLRYFCIEASNGTGQNCKTMQLADRMYRESSRFVVSLLRLLTNVNMNSCTRAPLLWHDVLLNSVVTVEEKTNALYRGLQQMCQVLDDIDTKSTNFFLSTVVTAVLTYHLGWVYSILPPQNRQKMEMLGSWYPCNPLWAQLGDLYGALGNPVKVAHTVVTGDPKKAELINSVLSFLSYFVRSGIVKRQQEYRCSPQQDLQDAIHLLEQARIKRPHLFNQTKPVNAVPSENSCFRRESRSIPIRKQMRISDTRSNDVNTQRANLQCPVDPSRTERSVSPMKRSATMKSNLNAYMSKSFDTEPDLKLPSKEQTNQVYEEIEKNSSSDNEKNTASSKVKIILSEVTPPGSDVKDQQQDLQFPLRSFEKSLEKSFEKKLDLNDTEEFASAKMDELQRDEADPLKFYTRPDFQSNSLAGQHKESQVFFTLGGEEKSAKTGTRPRLGSNCQCSYTFTRVPSTSAQLPEGVLRKIIQRNFPESSKSIQPPPGASSMGTRSFGLCLKCNGQGHASSQTDESSKQVLETPTNATEVLRTCGSIVGDINVGLSRSNSLEALMEANNVIELPMPRSKKVSFEKCDSEESGFTKTLLQTKVNDEKSSPSLIDAGYTWGLVIQGLTKRKRKRRKRKRAKQEGEENDREEEIEKEWWYYMREEVVAGAKFPTIDQPVAEALCILADLDTWHVGIISNNTPPRGSPLPVGMSRLVANMLEAFAYVWRKYHSPAHCVGILETKLREMWLRSEALAEMLMTVDVCDANVATLTEALDIDAADIPLLLAVATTHSPEIAQRFGLTLT